MSLLREKWSAIIMSIVTLMMRITPLLIVSLASGCSSANTWRADGFGVSASASSITIIYGEINKIPPGAHFYHTRAVDLRPAWKRWLMAPETNSVFYETIELDARGVITNATSSTMVK